MSVTSVGITAFNGNGNSAASTNADFDDFYLDVGHPIAAINASHNEIIGASGARIVTGSIVFGFDINRETEYLERAIEELRKRSAIWHYIGMQDHFLPPNPGVRNAVSEASKAVQLLPEWHRMIWITEFGSFRESPSLEAEQAQVEALHALFRELDPAPDVDAYFWFAHDRRDKEDMPPAAYGLTDPPADGRITRDHRWPSWDAFRRKVQGNA